MKLMHLSDLHIGKRVREQSMMDDQCYILQEILHVLDDEKPDAVLIAGDIYDKSMPSAEAVRTFDAFLVQLAERKVPVFIISGNHDSPERLSFGNRLMSGSGIHIAPVYDGTAKAITLQDAFGEVDIFMLPFVKPAVVRPFFPDKEIHTYTDAVAAAISVMNRVPGRRNVLLAHQFVTGASICDSEELSVGGSENVDGSVFAGFDYVALGHLHGPQNVGSPAIRYCGTPLKYSFSEVAHSKSITIAELGAEGDLQIRTVPLAAKRDMVVLRGKYEELMQHSYYEGTTYQDDYIRIILTDEEEHPNAFTILRTIYHNLLSFEYDNRRTKIKQCVETNHDARSASQLELFASLYEKQNNSPLSQMQTDYLEKLISEIWEDDVCDLLH